MTIMLSRDELINKGLWLVLALSLACTLHFAWAHSRLPGISRVMPTPNTAFSWPASIAPEPASWAVVQAGTPTKPTQTGPLSKRFRLAGTFFAFGEAGETSANLMRRAVVDDVQHSTQHLLSENDRIDDAEVVRIFRDRIVLRSQGREEELWLSFHESGSRSTGSSPEPSGVPTLTSRKPLEVNRFGKRVGDARWVFQREELMKYYREMLDDPERLASIYLSLKPDRDDKGKVAGYYLDPEGEGEFFDAVGLKPGDVIRKVNSMRMVSQARAEYFISEFVKDRMSAIVLDVERNDEKRKLIYLIR